MFTLKKKNTVKTKENESKGQKKKRFKKKTLKPNWSCP